MWIGVISDTGGSLSAEAIDVFSGVDYILHCGDIGDPQVLDALSQVAPVAGVIGANDDPELYPFGRSLFRKWFDVGIYVNHRIGEPMNVLRAVKKDVERFDPQVILFGHGNEAFNNRIDNRLFFNPGGAGKKRGRPERSVGLLEIEGRSVRGEIVPLNGR
jgi:putative phosphoesterase